MIRVTGLGVPDTDEGYIECGEARCWTRIMALEK